MISTVVERIQIKKVDKCMSSDKHLNADLAHYPEHVERFYCHLMHMNGPHYTRSLYAVDMILLMVIRPTKAKWYWSEFIREIRKSRNG